MTNYLILWSNFISKVWIFRLLSTQFLQHSVPAICTRNCLICPDKVWWWSALKNRIEVFYFIKTNCTIVLQIFCQKIDIKLYLYKAFHTKLNDLLTSPPSAINSSCNKFLYINLVYSLDFGPLAAQLQLYLMASSICRTIIFFGELSNSFVNQ